MKKTLLSFLLLCVFAITVANAQDRKITGSVVSSDDGLSLPGVSVSVTGTKIGTQTNLQGDFSLSVPASATSLTFTYIGFASSTVSILGKSVVNVKLISDSKSLNEVVVTGYGTQKKSEITGSIVSIKAADIQDKPLQTLDKVLQGRAAGVQVNSNSGQPGGGVNVVIRGVATINGSTQPLYIIDGVQITPGNLSGQTSVNALSSINPDDIESIEVIKDGAAAAVYGSLAGNGVVIVTTKRGKAGKTQISASLQYGASKMYNPYELLDATQFYGLQVEAYENFRQRQGSAPGVGTAAAAAANFPGGVVPSPIPSYNYVEAIQKTGKLTQADLSVSGGDAKTKFFISGSYNNTGGTIINSNFTRGSIRGNLDHRVSDKFYISSSITLTGSNQNGPTTQAGFFTNTPFTGALLTSPVNPIYKADGTFNTAFVGTNGQNTIQNLTFEKRSVGTFQTVSNLALTYNFTPEFSFKAFGGIDFSDLRDFNYRPSTLSAAAASLGVGNEQYRRNINYNTTGTFSYNKRFNNVHNISAIAGFEYRTVTNRILTATAASFPSPLLTLVSSGAVPSATGSTYTGYKIAGFLGQVKYDYEGKYLFTANVRNDGSSRFGENNKYGLFYGFSGGWIMTKEEFLKDNSVISTLKPRVSYGLTGSQPSSSAYDFISLPLYGGGGQYGSVLSGGLRSSQIPNLDFRWEKSSQIDLGLDIGLFNERVSLALDVYRKTNTDLILGVTIPGDVGFTSYTQNAGSAKSEGIDIDLNTVNIQSGGFRWSTNFNISFNRTKLLSLVNGQTQTGTFTYTVGKPLNNIYTYRWAGVNPADGRPMYFDANNNITYSPKTSDQQIIGNTNPKFFGGLSNTLSYKGIGLDFLFQYQYGNLSYLQSQQYIEQSGSLANNQSVNQLDRWTTQGQVTWVPRPYSNLTEPGGFSMQNLSSRFVEEASYIRLKTVTLSYAFPKSIATKLGVGSLSVFGQGLNLLTITNYRGDDPENTGNNLNFYPNPRTITAGINAKF